MKLFLFFIIVVSHQAQANSIKNLDDFLFPNQKFDIHKGPRTDAIILYKNGQIIHERYSRGYNKDKKHIAWSVSKTFLNAVSGRLVQQKKLDINTSICKHLKDVPTKFCDITVKHLLDWTSGLEWRETYEKTQDPTTSSVLTMLYGLGYDNFKKFIYNHKILHKPGTQWLYSSGDTNLLALFLNEKLKADGSDLRTYINKELIKPLGMNTLTIEENKDGLPLFSSHVFITARDLLQFSKMYLYEGKVEGTELLSSQWVKNSTQLNTTYLKTKAPNQNTYYASGRQLWVNQSHKLTNNKKAWKHLPEDAFAARGHWGQMWFVIPSMNAIFVRLGDHRNKEDFDFDQFTKLVMDALKGDKK